VLVPSTVLRVSAFSLASRRDSASFSASVETRGGTVLAPSTVLRVPPSVLRRISCDETVSAILVRPGDVAGEAFLLLVLSLVLRASVLVDEASSLLPASFSKSLSSLWSLSLDDEWFDEASWRKECG
jgi:hypothetical protein